MSLRQPHLVEHQPPRTRTLTQPDSTPDVGTGIVGEPAIHAGKLQIPTTRHTGELGAVEVSDPSRIGVSRFDAPECVLRLPEGTTERLGSANLDDSGDGRPG